MKMRTKVNRLLCLIVAVFMVLQMVPVQVNAAKEFDLVTTPFPVNYDPNDGLIHYGHYGDRDDIGMRVENDTNDYNFSGNERINFPNDVRFLRDENNQLYFPDYDPDNAYYDYTDMFIKAMEMARNKGNIELHVNPGVYYFTGSIPLWGYIPINGEAGKTAFVVKPNYIDGNGNTREEYGFFTAADPSKDYAWYFNSVSDLTIVVEDTHPSFKPTSTYNEIYENLLSDDVQAVKNYNLFYRVRIAYGGIWNNAASGFHSYLAWSFTDMLTKVQDNTFGPCRRAIDGCQTNDAMFANNIFYGGYFTNEYGLSQMPTFQNAFSLGTTTFSNSYIGNFQFGRSGAGTWSPHGTYSNITFERVYSVIVDTTARANIAISGCYFKDCSRKDIVKYFEKQGLNEYMQTRWWDSANSKWVYDGPDGYIIPNSFTDAEHYRSDTPPGQIICIFHPGSLSISQCKFECDSLEDTILLKMWDSKWDASYSGLRRGAWTCTFTDNAFKVNTWDYKNLLLDDWGGRQVFTPETLANGYEDHTWLEWGISHYKDGEPVYKYIGVEKPEKIAWTEGMVLVSPELEWHFEFTGFGAPDAPTNGYAAQGMRPVGADEKQLYDTMRDRCYQDIESGMEMVYLSDFGATTYDSTDNYQALQTAFDYAATHEAILYIEEGDYNLGRPIVLRGGETYRILCDGKIVANYNSSQLENKGIFVMDKDDKDPINGYFTGLSMELKRLNGTPFCSAFYNVNMENMLLKMGSLQRGIGVFTNCRLEDCIIKDGQMQYFSYGWFWKSTVKNTVITNVYGTGSTGVEGEDGIAPDDTTYRFLISSSDLINCSMRANWLEFLQFSNGKKLTGEGNSLYRGNLIDYTYNYSFGRNDVFVGNTLSRGSYGSITNHMTGSNFPIEIPDNLLDHMVLFHVSDGLKLIGNADVATLDGWTHFVEFDSPTIRYTNANGEEVYSISNARIAGNLTTPSRDEGYGKAPVVTYGVGENIVLENCLNNQLEFQLFWTGDGKSDGYTANEEDLWKVSLPGVDAYVNGQRVQVTIEKLQEKNYVSTTEPQRLEPVAGTQPEQDEEFKIGNIYEGAGEDTTKHILFDFNSATDPEAAERLKNELAHYIAEDTMQLYIDSMYNVADMDGDGVKEPISYSDIKPENKNDLYRQCMQYAVENNINGLPSFYMNQKRFDNSKRSKSAPTYAIVLDNPEWRNENIKSAQISVWNDTFENLEHYMKRSPIYIYGEDADKYYGIALTYNKMDGIMAGPVTISKNPPANTERNEFAEAGGSGINLSGSMGARAIFDKFSGIQSWKGIFADYFDDVYMYEKVLDASTTISDKDRFASTVLGFNVVLDYNHTYKTVSAKAVVDFTPIGDDNGKKATTRNVNLGTHSIENMYPVFGFFGGTLSWIDYIQIEHTGDLNCKDGNAHTFNADTVVSKTCTKDGVVRNICSVCGYSYVSGDAANGHTFTETAGALKENGYTDVTSSCTKCDFSFTEERLVYVNECPHDYRETTKAEPDCVTSGRIDFVCRLCNDEKSDYLQELGHDYVRTVVKPTDTEEGYILFTCSRCNDSYTDEYVEEPEGPDNPPSDPPSGGNEDNTEDEGSGSSDSGSSSSGGNTSGSGSSSSGGNASSNTSTAGNANASGSTNADGTAELTENKPEASSKKPSATDTGSLKVVVTDETTKEPLADIKVQVKGPDGKKNIYTTDKDGVLFLEDIPAGIYEITTPLSTDDAEVKVEKIKKVEVKSGETGICNTEAVPAQEIEDKPQTEIETEPAEEKMQEEIAVSATEESERDDARIPIVPIVLISGAAVAGAGCGLGVFYKRRRRG